MKNKIQCSVADKTVGNRDSLALIENSGGKHEVSRCCVVTANAEQDITPELETLESSHFGLFKSVT